MAWLGAGKPLMYQSWHLLNMGFCPCRKRTWCSQGSKARVWERFLGVFISLRPPQSSTTPWLDSASTGKAWCPIKSIYVKHQTCLNPHPSGTMHRRPIKEVMTPGPSQHSAVFAKHAQTGATKLERSTPQGLAPLYMTRYISFDPHFLVQASCTQNRAGSEMHRLLRSSRLKMPRHLCADLARCQHCSSQR